MIIVDFTFLEALETLYNNNYKSNNEDRRIIGIATNEMLKNHMYITFVKDNEKNYLRFMVIHGRKKIKPFFEYVVTAEDFNKKWHLYYAMDALVKDVNRVSKNKIE